MYEACAGVRLNATHDGAGGGVSSSAFQRLSRRLGVHTTSADLIFTKICTYETGGFSNRMMTLNQFTEGLVALAEDPKSGIDTLAHEGIAGTLSHVVERLL